MYEAQGIRKRYGGVTALAGVDFTLEPGSVHALLGENGAGKSTLVKILAGATAPDAGKVTLNGAPVTFTNTREAAKVGIAVVSQELNVFPDLDVLANLFLTREPRRGPLVSTGPRWPGARRPCSRSWSSTVHFGRCCGT